MARIVEERDLTEHILAVSASTPTRAKAHEAGTSGGDALLKTILASLEDDKAEDVVTIPLAGKSQMADHMVVASGRSSRQVGAMAEHLADTLKRDSGMICRTEGKDLGDWVLIDAGDVIVHLFRPEVREFYQLEKMWLPAGGAAPKAADTV
jgi:ribosome-associated protein